MSIESSGNKVPGNHERHPAQVETLLHIFRHGKKAGGNDVSQEEDLVMPLKPEGKMESIAHGKEIDRLPDSWSIAVGSSRLRAQETAAFTRGAMNPDLVGDESLTEVQEHLGETLPGQKVWTDKRLDMPFVKGETPEFDDLLAASNRGEYLARSYELFEAAGEGRNATTYGRQVHNIASLIFRQGEINKKIAERRAHEGAGSETPEAIERFMGTHGGITESFLSEFIQRTKGETQAERFRKLFPQGFSYNEGMDVRIVSDAGVGEPSVRVTMNVDSPEEPYTLDETVPLSMIKSIVEDFS